MIVRSPICVLIGHVDHGKSSIIDRIRGTSKVEKEAGGITQHISSATVSIKDIKNFCGDLLKKLKLKITIPGLLFIDTPGHAAFTNLRKRGGNLSDIAILVIDINEGIKPQTLESIDILKQYKTPFVIALNKIDLISGYRKQEGPLLENINKQSESVKKLLDEKLYKIVAKLDSLGFNSERFDRVEDYTKQIAMVPLSAKTKEGIAELLMVVTGLAQKYLEESLKIEVKGQGKATILEVTEEKGLGICLDIILYDGSIKINDKIVIGGIDDVIVTKVKSLIDNKKKVKCVSAASSVHLNAPNVEGVVSGMPLRVANKDLEKIKSEIKKEIQEIIIETDNEGVILKADSLGSLEALTGLLKDKNVSIRRASIGDITKKDLIEAKASKNELNKVILGFNVKGYSTEEVKVICNNVIYKIVEDFEKWLESRSKELESSELEEVVTPCKLLIMPDCIFRQSNPAVVGVMVLGGKLKPNTNYFKESGIKFTIKSIQSEGENVSEAKKGDEVAISIPGVTVGRQIKENDELFTNITEEDCRKLKRLKKYLKKDELDILKEIVNIKRKDAPVWGV